MKKIKKYDEYQKLLDEKITVLNSQIQGIDKDIFAFKDMIKELTKKRRDLEFQKTQHISDWHLSTSVDFEDRWEGKRRPTGFK